MDRKNRLKKVKDRQADKRREKHAHCGRTNIIKSLGS